MMGKQPGIREMEGSELGLQKQPGVAQTIIENGQAASREWKCCCWWIPFPACPHGGRELR
jgi:hypothetical protein